MLLYFHGFLHDVIICCFIIYHSTSSCSSLLHLQLFNPYQSLNWNIWRKISIAKLLSKVFEIYQLVFHMLNATKLLELQYRFRETGNGNYNKVIVLLLGPFMKYMFWGTPPHLNLLLIYKTLSAHICDWIWENHPCTHKNWNPFDCLL